MHIDITHNIFQIFLPTPILLIGLLFILSRLQTLFIVYCSGADATVINLISSTRYLSVWLTYFLCWLSCRCLCFYFFRKIGQAFIPVKNIGQFSKIWLSNLVPIIWRRNNLKTTCPLVKLFCWSIISHQVYMHQKHELQHTHPSHWKTSLRSLCYSGL